MIDGPESTCIKLKKCTLGQRQTGLYMLASIIWRHEVWNGSYLLLSRILCQRNPWSGEDCGRTDCQVFGDGEEGGGAEVATREA